MPKADLAGDLTFPDCLARQGMQKPPMTRTTRMGKINSSFLIRVIRVFRGSSETKHFKES
jgi:hypothetical protein